MLCIRVAYAIMQCLSVYLQGDHLSGKPGNIREFDSCQGNDRDFAKMQRNVRKNICQEKWSKLFTASFIFVSILDFAEIVHFILVSDRGIFDHCCIPTPTIDLH